MFKKIYLFVTLVILKCISNVWAFQMNMNTLHLSNADTNSKIDSIFEAYGMNYMTVKLPVTSLELEKDGVALYNSIVIEGATKEIVNGILPQIETYQKKYKVRVAYINCEPNETFGFIEGTKSISEEDTVSLTPQGLELAKKYQMNGKDVKFKISTCVVNSKHLCDTYHHYSVKFAPNSSVTPLLKYDDSTDKYAGAIVKKGDGLESIHFFTSNIDDPITYFSGHLWVSWTNYGLIDGFRRLYFGIQIDDFFINNPFNYTKGTEYRTSIEDMKNLAQWQKDILNRMPKGSQFKIELGLNGNYILSYAHHKSTLCTDWTSYDVAQDYVKPLSEVGSHRYPKLEEIDSQWDDKKIREGDKLYDYFAKNPTAQDDFYWLTHTFGHHNLNFASFHDADMEIYFNIKITDEPYLGMYKRDCYSPHSIICPEISGLHNGHTLQAFAKNGIHYAVGDTSRRDLDPKDGNFYLPLITTTETSNFDGFLVIPRQPTEMYWDCSTADQILSLKKERTGESSDWKTHLENEGFNHVENFLKMRHDPYMFHEGNLRNVDAPEVDIHGTRDKFGLMQQWVETVVYEIKRYMDWPLITLKMDDLAETYIKRIDQKACQPKYTMVIDDQTFEISEIKISSTAGKCQVPLLAIRNTPFDEKTVDRVERFGNEPPTAWVEVNQTTPKSIKFVENPKWNDDTTYDSTTAIKGSSTTSSSISFYSRSIVSYGLVILGTLLLMTF